MTVWVVKFTGRLMVVCPTQDIADRVHKEFIVDYMSRCKVAKPEELNNKTLNELCEWMHEHKPDIHHWRNEVQYIES